MAFLDETGLAELWRLNKERTYAKDESLSHTTRVVLGISDGATPDDAFLRLALGADKKAMYIRVTTPKGIPLAGLTINGVTDVNGKTAVTDSDGGVVSIAPNDTSAISITSPYIDLVNYSGSVTADPNQVVTNITIVLQPTAAKVTTWDTSVSGLKFSPDVVKYDVCCVGGGGAGGVGHRVYDDGDPTYYGGTGGAGGDIVSLLNQTHTFGSVFSCTIGAGGARSGDYQFNVSGNSGGATTCMLNGSTILTANGGAGGPKSASSGSVAGATSSKNGGNGGNSGSGAYRAGTAGTAGGHLFGDSSEMQVCGGGGGGGMSESSSPAGGSPYGGKGSYYTMKTVNNSHVEYYMRGDATGPGGGGGGAGNTTNIYGNQAYIGNGAGYKGLFALRWRYSA